MRRLFLIVFSFLFAAVLPIASNAEGLFPQNGTSYGGKVRSGPGVHYRQTGSLREGDDIRIMNGTGIMTNGYEWFQIRYGRNLIGYQWGGIMCSQRPHPTIYKTCTTLHPGAIDPAPPSSAKVKGRNVSRVMFHGGSFKQSGWREWQETGAQGRVRFNFTETARDEWSVYLFDRSRNVAVQLDLHRRKISVGNGNQPKADFYNITSVAANPNLGSNQPQQPTGITGYTVAHVIHPRGTFTDSGNGSWDERNQRGQVTYRFQEQARDDWSVYLFDSSRNVALQLDLHRKKILIGFGNGPKSDLYNITSSAARH